ncbi:MAG: hypothetical protein DWP95_03040 [Proteobacteria bacterium]|nr:MAG: hypothetical protein DWP95_03040 [Pseudomonadota bacterium]
MAGLKVDWLAAAYQPATEVRWPDWMQAKKQAALATLSTLPGPSRKLELWRYSDADRLQKSELDSAANTERELTTADNAVVINLTTQGVDFDRNLPDWLSLKPIQELPENQWLDMDLSPALAKELVVQSLNQGLFTHGVVVDVSAQAPQDATVVLRYDVAEFNRWTYLRNVINIEKNAAVTIDEHYVTGRINVVNNYRVAQNARLTRHQHNVLHAGQQHVSLQHFTLAENAYVESQNRHESGNLQHHIHWVDFTAEQAEYRSGSVNKAGHNSHIADIVLINHAFKNNISDVTHRSLADDSAQIFNNAKAVVAKGADGSEITQDLKNILLSGDAKIASKPELEVYTDEVVAAHGSTIGALDENVLFFLRSRGIGLEQAKAIMMVSFEQEAIIC